MGISLRRGAVFERDWTKGGTLRNLLLLSWPIVVLQGLFPISQIIEMIWVGRLGAAIIAGVGVASIIDGLVQSMDTGILTGARAMVARLVGAGDVGGANHVAGQAFVLGAAFSIVIAAIGVFLAEPILSLFGLKPDVVAEGAVYMRIMLAGYVTMSFWRISFHIMQASGDSVTPMKVAILIRSTHAVLSPFLIFGWWIFPRLGVSGAATANIIYQALGMFITLWVFFNGRTRLRLTMRDFRPDPNIMRRILKIGIPVSVMGLQRSFSSVVLTWFMVAFGTLAVAAHSLAHRVEGFINMPAMGLGSGAGVLTGQNLGARQPERAERTGWLAGGVVAGFAAGFSVAILLWAENIIGIFSTEPGLVEVGSIFLRIATAGYLVMALISVMQSCITGAGDTLPAMLVSLAMIWVVQLPLAFLLPRVTGLGVYGVRWAMVVGMLVAAVAYTTYFRTGRWKHKKV